MPQITIDTAQEGDVFVIRVRGELDLNGCLRLELALAKAENAQPGRVHLDLEGVTFIDSSGIEAVVKANRRSAIRGKRLEITRGNGVVADMFRMSALDATLPLTDPPRAMPEAMRPVPPPSRRRGPSEHPHGRDGSEADRSAPAYDRMLKYRSALEARDMRLQKKVQELAVFRDAGLLTDVELEEQKAKLRWGLA